MKKSGLVTIMVPVLNGELFLPLALDSLLAQDYPHFEVIILDNQSTDRTGEICRDYERRDARVKYVLDMVNRISHRGDSFLANAWRYLGQRRVVPTIFGLYRSDAYLAALPFDTFDETIADVDNLFLINLLVHAKVQGIDEVLFFYRNKYRGYDPSLASGSPKGTSGFQAWLFFTQHQWRFLHKIIDILETSHMSSPAKCVLRMRARYTFGVAITILRVRAQIGRILIWLGLREGPPAKKDIHFAKRSTALHDVGYDPVGRSDGTKES